MGTPRKWSTEQLAPAVARSSTFYEVADALGLARGSEANDRVRAHCTELGISVEHFRNKKDPQNPTRVANWLLRNLVGTRKIVAADYGDT